MSLPNRARWFPLVAVLVASTPCLAAGPGGAKAGGGGGRPQGPTGAIRPASSKDASGGGAKGSGRVSARELLDEIDDLYRGDSAHGKMTMKVETEHWTRELGLEFWSKGKDETLIRILSPKKERGTATLKSGNNIWNYLPKVNRVIKVPSSMMGGAWMGSHFTNDDLVKESRMAEDYRFGEPEPKGELLVIRCEPKPDAVVVWGKIEVTVRAKDHMPVEILYYDEDLRLARTLRFSDYRVMSGRLMPTVMRMEPADSPGEFTEIRYQEIELGVDLDDAMFSIQRLGR